MNAGAYPCPLCGGLHDEARRICPTTGKRIPDPPGGALDGTEQALLGKTLADRYRVRGILGQGGMAAVFEATDLQTDRVVAIKVLRQKHARNHVSVKRLMREAKLAGSLGHKAICQVLDMGQLADMTPYLVTERLYGETVAQRLTRDKFLPFEDAIAIMMQVLEALGTAHARSIVHRDITPGNVFILEPSTPGNMDAQGSRGPVVKILDFGFSKMLLPSGDDNTETGLTGEGIVVGTPHYMSPEQIRGDKELDGRADLFAVGAVLYRTLTGERPFSGPTMSAVLHAILTKTPPAPSTLRADLPKGIDLVVQTAMQRDKTKRFRDAADFRGALAVFHVERVARPTSSGPSFDVFEESGEQGPPHDSIEVEFSSSVDPSADPAPQATAGATPGKLAPPGPNVARSVPRFAERIPREEPSTQRNTKPEPPGGAHAAATPARAVVDLAEDELATVERNPGVDGLLELEEAALDHARGPLPRPSPSDPSAKLDDILVDSDERTFRRPPEKPRLPPRPLPPPPPRKK